MSELFICISTGVVPGLSRKITVPVAQWLEHCIGSAKVVGPIPREHTY